MARLGGYGWVSCCVLLVGCGAKSGETGDGDGGRPNLPVSACGDAWTWLPRNNTGAVVAIEAADEFSLDVDAIRGLMAVAGASDTDEAKYSVRVFRVRYTTQDRGEEVEATQLVALPDVPGETFPSVLYHHPTTGFDDFCAPSGRDLIWAGVPVVMASMGFAVAAPDYLGQAGFGEEAPEWHPYLVAEPTAVVSLDALKAMWAFVDGDLGGVGVDVSRDTVLVGASQGGGAAFWSERYAEELLPEARLRGTVSLVPLMDVETWTIRATETLLVASAAVPLMFESMRMWYRVDAQLSDVVGEDGVSRVLETMTTTCPAAEIPEDISATTDIFTASFLASVSATDTGSWEPWGCMVAENSPASSSVGRGAEVPAFVVLGGQDDIALTEQSRKVVADLCAAGHPIVAQECADTGHTSTVQATLDLTLYAIRTFAAGDAMPGEVCGDIPQVVCDAP